MESRQERDMIPQNGRPHQEVLRDLMRYTDTPDVRAYWDKLGEAGAFTRVIGYAREALADAAAPLGALQARIADVIGFVDVPYVRSMWAQKGEWDMVNALIAESRSATLLPEETEFRLGEGRMSP
jgi:hypothetical protein